MSRAVNWMSGAALGAGFMYFLDPDRGKRRRALVRDKATRLTTLVERGTDKTRCDLANRRRGIAAFVAAHIPFRSEEPADYILEARVRSRIGRLVSHPHAIEIRVRQGVITLSGDVLASEAASLLSGVSGMAGVSSLENQLHLHEKPGDFPGLQGNTRKPQRRFELLQTNWSPAARFVTGSAGTALGIYGVCKGGIRGTAAGMAGAGLLARSLTNMEFKRLLGTQPGCCIDVRKTINIAVPVEKVYEFWSNYENFPLFMTHLKDVRETGPGRSHWIASGPGGATVEWDAEITRVVPNQLLVWKSIPSSVIENTGSIRFDRNGDSGTRLTIQLSYQPPAGAVGHAFAKLFGSDPKQAMDEDLIRLKSLLEIGKTRVRGEIVIRSRLQSLAKPLVPAGDSQSNRLAV